MSFFETEKKPSTKGSLPWLMACETRINHEIILDLASVKQTKKSITSKKGDNFEIDIWTADFMVGSDTLSKEEIPREFFDTLDWHLDQSYNGSFSPVDYVNILFRRYAWKDGNRWIVHYPMVVTMHDDDTL